MKKKTDHSSVKRGAIGVRIKAILTLASLGAIAQVVTAGTWVRDNPSPAAADMGTANATVPSLLAPNGGTIQNSTGPYTTETRYLWYWEPTPGKTLITDPPPSIATVKHSYALGGGPMEATAHGVIANATAYTKFSASLKLTSASTEHNLSAYANATGPNSTTVNIPTTLHTQTTNVSIPSSTTSFQVITVVSAKGEASATSGDSSSTASATVRGRIKTFDVNVVP